MNRAAAPNQSVRFGAANRFGNLGSRDVRRAVTLPASKPPLPPQASRQPFAPRAFDPPKRSGQNHRIKTSTQHDGGDSCLRSWWEAGRSILQSVAFHPNIVPRSGAVRQSEPDTNTGITRRRGSTHRPVRVEFPMNVQTQTLNSERAPGGA